MNFGKAFGVALLSLIGGLAAHAQVGIYAGYSGSKLSGINCLVPSTQVLSTSSGSCSNGGAGYTGSTGSPVYSSSNINPSGLMFGAYYDFRNIGPVRLGGDFRFIDAHDNKSASSSVGGTNATGSRVLLLGLRGSIHTHYKWLTPYGEIAFGRNSTNATETNSGVTGNVPPRQYDNFLQYEVFAGADVHIFPFLDLRPIELGIGGANRVGSGTGSSSFGVQSVAAGVVFHLPHP